MADPIIPRESPMTVTLLDAGDGSGDCLLPIPEPVWEALRRQGWREGMDLEIEADPQGRILVRPAAPKAS